MSSADPIHCFLSRLVRLNDIRDEEGRPLGERRVPKARRADVAMEVKECPYAGRRHGMPMNVSALKQMVDRWPKLLTALRELKEGYGQRHMEQIAEHPWPALLGVSLAGVALPLYLLERREAPRVSGELPATVGALYKILIGVSTVVRGLVVDNARALDGLPMPTPQIVFAASEEKGLLIADGEACAGPPQLIGQALSVLMGVVEPEDTGPVLGPLIGDLAPLWEIARWSTEQALLAEVFRLSDIFAEGRLLAGFSQHARKRAPDSPTRLALDRLEALQHRPPSEDLARAVEKLGAALLPGEDVEIISAYPDGWRWPAEDPEPPPELLELLDASEAGARVSSDARKWIAKQLVRYTTMRRAHTRLAIRAESAITRSLGATDISDEIPLADRDLYPRAHTQAWLESLAGVYLVIDPSGGPSTAIYKDHELLLP